MGARRRVVGLKRSEQDVCAGGGSAVESWEEWRPLVRAAWDVNCFSSRIPYGNEGLQVWEWGAALEGKCCSNQGRTLQEHALVVYRMSFKWCHSSRVKWGQDSVKRAGRLEQGKAFSGGCKDFQTGVQYSRRSTGHFWNLQNRIKHGI